MFCGHNNLVIFCKDFWWSFCCLQSWFRYFVLHGKEGKVLKLSLENKNIFSLYFDTSMDCWVYGFNVISISGQSGCFQRYKNLKSRKGVGSTRLVSSNVSLWFFITFSTWRNIHFSNFVLLSNNRKTIRNNFLLNLLKQICVCKDILFSERKNSFTHCWK